MKVLTVSEEDMSCSVPWILRVPEVIDQSLNRLKKQYGNVTVTFICLVRGISQVFDKTEYRLQVLHYRTKTSCTGAGPCTSSEGVIR